METLSAMVTVQGAEMVIGQFEDVKRNDEVNSVLWEMSAEIFIVTVLDVDTTLLTVCVA